MSVLIKDMQMPKNCSECPVALSGKYCRINNTYTTYIKLPIRPDHCPLAEFPDHHGRLIDADAVTNKYGEWYTEEGSEEGFIGTIKDIINLVPTVIKSE